MPKGNVSANAVDAFIRERLAKEGLALSPPADRRTLIRRVYYDLTGLPPTYEEIEQFASDTDPQAYEKLVDKLLDSPGYGEHWARHWLDVVHYGDSHGFDKDKVRPNAWPYRDYVIRALNADKPYTQFVKEQLAGDVFYPNTTDGVVTLNLGFAVDNYWFTLLNQGLNSQFITEYANNSSTTAGALSLTLHGPTDPAKLIDGFNVNVTGNAAGQFQIPEPGSIFLMGAGLAGLAAIFRKSRP